MPLQSQVFLVNKKGVRDVPQAVTAGHTTASTETRPTNEAIEALGRDTVSHMDQVRTTVLFTCNFIGIFSVFDINKYPFRYLDEWCR